MRLSMEEFLCAAVLALFVTWLIKTLSKLFKSLVSGSLEFDFKPSDYDEVIERCCELFPNELLVFGGTTFRRGMRVVIVTSKHRKIEGRLIGKDDDNMVCLITDRHVIAQELDALEEMSEI